MLLCLILSSVGTLMVASATHRTSDGAFLYRDARVMVLALLLGLFACLVISFIDYDIILKLWPLVAAGTLFLMLLLIPFATAPGSREDARSWLKITGSLYLQPSELLKIGFIITFSKHLSVLKNDLSSVKNVFLLCVHAAVPIALVVYTGDMGSALIFMLMFVGMMFIAGVHWAYFPIGVAAVGAALPFVWYKVFDNIQRDRFLALLDPESYPNEIYQQQQASNAIREGGFFGSGLFQGAYTQSGSVPESENDMIFTVVCEETGLLGAFVLLLLFALLAIRIVYVGKRANNFSASMLCYGVMFMIIAQVVVNIGMCLKLLPVIGITLPFISAGGSSVVSLYLAVGLVLSVYRSSGNISYEDDFRYERIARQI